jgi:hypothetical protein
MSIASFKDLCIDTTGGEELGRFWAAALGLRFEPDDDAGKLVGDDPAQSVWMNTVPEEKTVKHRVHLDVHTASIDDLVELGATVHEPAEQYGRSWTVMLDPAGGEFCAFVRSPDEVPGYRLFEMIIDCVDPKASAQWWAGVFACKLEGRDDKNWWWIVDVPGLPFESWDFVPVPEPKTVKNRIHWDVWVDSVDDLVRSGATVLRPRDEEISWTVMADPEGNEFCAFVR